jgi:hypothetical protein
MTEQVAERAVEESLESEDTSQEVSEQEGTPAADPEATWRKRLNGQVAATNKAIEERKALEARLAKYEQAERDAANAGKTELEILKAEKADAERRAQEAEQKAADRYLDKLYPKARAEFPEIRDEVRLAKLEAAFSDDAPAEVDSPRSMRAPKNASSGQPREKTIEELEADLAKMSFPTAFGR